jgi:CubicO group peptidase (beta-lactamase class C family)
MAEIHGTCDDRFDEVRNALSAHLDEELDVGASVAVSLQGEPVVDIWGGFTDEARTTPWERDTITNVWSTTKTMTALSALLLADKGELDVHAPVARYWPEFKAAGKESIEVRHLLSHTAGLSGWSEPMTVEDLFDWEKATSLLAAQEPWWEPGTASGYHAVTQGYLVGEVVRRITGQSLGAFFAAEVAGPLGADFYIGLPASEDGRVANVIPPPTTDLTAAGLSEIGARTLGNPLMTADASWTRAWRAAEIPAANGHGNARAVVAAQSGLVTGFVSRSTCDLIFDEQARGTDLVLSTPLRLGIGYGLNAEETPLGPNPRTCFWGGWGGSVVVIDLDSGLVVAYMMNKMGDGLVGDMRGFEIVMAAFEGLATR